MTVERAPSSFVGGLWQSVGARIDPARATMLVGWASRILSALAQFVAVRFLIDLLGVDGYGSYAVIIGLLTWFTLADLGLGYSLQNHISARRVAGEDAFDAIRAVAMTLGAFSLILFPALLLVSYFVGPFLLSSFASVSTGDAWLALFLFAALASGTTMAGIILKVWFAEHRGYVAHLATLVGVLIGVAGVAVLASFRPSHPLIWAVVVYYLPAFLIPAVALAHLLARRASTPATGKSGVAPLWPSARWFVLFAFLGALTLNLDYVILSQTVSLYDIAVYAIIARVYTLAMVLFTSVLTAYWPLSSEALQRGDHATVRAIIRRALIIGTILVLGVTVALAALAEPIAALLSPRTALTIPRSLLIFFLIYFLLRVWTDTYSAIIMSSGNAVIQCAVVPIQAALSLGIGYLGATYYGLPGLLVGLSACFVLTVAWVLPLYVHRTILNAPARPTGIPSVPLSDETM